jgi:O-acetyl-ADP-ribose deacetylase (regulator of RNase III)
MRIEIFEGDITTLSVSAVVNAANESLLGGGGVDGAIHRAAGPRLYDTCRSLGGCATGRAKLTDGFDLPARYIIHAVGPIWRGGDRGEAGLLESCYRECLQLAFDHCMATIAFPSISTGIYAYPPREACEIATRTVRGAAFRGTVVFVCFDSAMRQLYESQLAAAAES